MVSLRIERESQVEDSSWKEKFIPTREGVSLDEFPGRRSILVIAPHPDDDVLGAGGTMAEAAGRQVAVFSVYMTDGRGSPRAELSLSDEEMALRREKEAVAALKGLRAAGGFFLRRGSLELEGEGGRQTKRELINILQGILPEEVFLPSPYERHATHQRCISLAIEALRAAKNVKPALLGYSLWGCFWGGKRRVLRDITPHIKKKVEAVLAHASQIAYKNYQQGILGKNNFEAIFWESHEPQKMAFAENFLEMSEFLANINLSVEEFMRKDMELFISKYVNVSGSSRP